MTSMAAISDHERDAQSRDTSLCSEAASGSLIDHNGNQTSVTWQLPLETPVALQINSEAFTVMMATPADLRDFAIGLAIAEGIVAKAAAIQGVLVMPVERGITLDIAIAESDLHRERIGRRSIEGRSGCGLCGVEDIASALRPLTPLKRVSAPLASAIMSATNALKDRQPMNRHNRSVHAAAFADANGDVKLVREDVGRHNALDKLIGALAQSDINTTGGFVVMTSRCSFELVQKTVTAGLTGLVSVSAPTALALDLAKDANLFLAALGPGGVVVFNG